ncbi:MAG: nitrilase-related carbon-nitrogen hydrolase, partial [Prochlorotrichaceae cyanobacterium]
MIPLTITIAQLNPTIGRLAQNAQQILSAANQAFEQGSQLLLTPELSLCGYPPKDLLLNDSFVDLIQQTLEQLAQDLPPQLPVLVGTIDRNLQAKIKGEKPLFNSVALLHQGSIKRQFYKRLLPNYDVFDEHRYFQSGNDRNWFILEPNAYKIGVTICEDFWNDEVFWGQRHYPVDPIAEIAGEKVDCIVNLAASPYTVGKQQLREKLLIHGAKRYQCPIFYVNQVGGNDDLVFDGHSVAIAADGAILARAQGFVTGLVTVQMPVA